jgi:hypothetical protein
MDELLFINIVDEIMDEWIFMSEIYRCFKMK